MTKMLTEQMITEEVKAIYEPVLVEKIAKLAKVARRIGVPEPTLEITERFTKMEPPPEDYRGAIGPDYKIPVPYIRYTITGQAPKLDGDWEVLARVDMTEAGNLVNTNPTLTDFDAEAFRTIGTGCDFCGKNRARTAIIVVRDRDGTIKKIGRNCVRAFFGYELPAVWQLWTEPLGNIGNQRDGRILEDDPFMVALLGFAVAKVDGRYVGRNYRGATGDKVYMIMRGRDDDADKVRRMYLPVDDATMLKAQAAFKWITEEADTDGNTFLLNLKTAILAGLGTTKFNLIVALVVAYEKAMGTPPPDATPKPELVAVPFAKETVTGEVTKVYLKETDFGDRWVMVVRDDRGFEVWGTVPKTLLALGVAVGERVRFTADLEPADRKGFGFFKRPTAAGRI